MLSGNLTRVIWNAVQYKAKLHKALSACLKILHAKETNWSAGSFDNKIVVYWFESNTSFKSVLSAAAATIAFLAQSYFCYEVLVWGASHLIEMSG